MYNNDITAQLLPKVNIRQNVANIIIIWSEIYQENNSDPSTVITSHCWFMYIHGVHALVAIIYCMHLLFVLCQIPCAADGRSVYRFRYTETPVFLFISHEAVETYSFFAVSVDIPVIHISVGPLCNDTELELLNSGTALVRTAVHC